MKTPLSFFFILLIIGFLPISSGDQITVTATILSTVETGEIELAPEEFTLDPDETLDVSDKVQVIDETQEESIGDVTVPLKQQIELSTTTGETVELTNTDLEKVVIEIPNEIIVSANVIWDGKILPPSNVTTTGTISSAFQTPTTAIQVGSPFSVLIFDKAVTITIEDITGQIAYKLSGTIEWILMDTCTGTYDSPIDPPVNGECFISDEVDTKIVTFHFTQFAPVKEAVDETTTKTSGGSHSTGISVSNAEFYDENKNSNALPIWLKQPVVWWNDDQITAQEFSSIMGWLIDEDIIKIEDKTKPEKQIITMAPSTKHLFSLWEKGLLPEYMILNLVETYRGYGVW